MNMKTTQRTSKCKRLRTLALTVACWAAGVLYGVPSRAAVVVRNVAGVEASITGILYYPSDNSIGVQFYLNAPNSTNITTFMIQKSLDLKTWTDYSMSMTVTGSQGQTEIADFVTAPSQFYRIQLSDQP